MRQIGKWRGINPRNSVIVLEHLKIPTYSGRNFEISYFCLFSCTLGKTSASAFIVFFKVIWNQFTVLDLPLLIWRTKQVNAIYWTTLLYREAFSILFARAALAPAMDLAAFEQKRFWSWCQLRSAMSSTRRTASRRGGHLIWNHRPASIWAGCDNCCVWASLRNLQLL